MSTWYYSDAQRNRLGPVAADDLALLHHNGQLAPEVLVWREGLPDWKPWREVMDEVLGRASTPAAAAPASAPAASRASFAVATAEAPAHVSGNPYELVERAPVAASSSPYAAPMAPVGGHMAVVHDGEVVYAGFWKRFAAYTIDSLVVGIVGAILQMVIAGVMFGGMAALGNPSELLATGAGIGGLLLLYLAPLALGAAYYGFFHASANQASLGKMAVGIKVTDEYGEHISFWRGFWRYFGLIVSSIPLGIGLIMAGFTDRKRALHDMMCSTLVVDRWAFTAHPERQRRELGTVTVVIIALAALLVVGYIVLIGVLVAAFAGAR